MNRIENVIPMDDHILVVVLDNGEILTIDFKSRLHTVRYSLLSDEKYFKKVTTDGTCVRWNFRIEIPLNEVFEMAQKQENH